MIETFWAHCSGKFTIWFHLDIVSPWKMLYHRLQGSSTSGKPVLPWRQVNILAVYTRSNHEQTLSESTTVIHGAAWLQLATFPPIEDALPWTTRPFNTWKTSIAMNSSAVSILTISTGSSQVLHIFTAYFAISAYKFWLRWLQCNRFFHMACRIL